MIKFDQIWNAQQLIDNFEDELIELTDEYEVDFMETKVDDYDTSLEIYHDSWPAYPWEPPRELIDKIKESFGFLIVYWNFTECGDEIRGNEPRRKRSSPHKYIENIGYVDDRFNKSAYEELHTVTEESGEG